MVWDRCWAVATKQLFFATTNQGKLKEGKLLLKEAGYQVLSLLDFPKLKDVEIEETGSSFAENAYLKAKAFGELSQKLTVAEDAGLKVKALKGRPGVKSARFAKDAQTRNLKLLKLMKNKSEREAEFVSVLALYDPETEDVAFYKGVVTGQIAPEIKGQTGFGYDPVFIPDGYQKTFAELGSSVKNEVSHRRRAFASLISALAETD